MKAAPLAEIIKRLNQCEEPITLRELALLLALHERRGAPFQGREVRTLVSVLGLPKGVISRGANFWERHRMIARQKNTADARLLALELTLKGARFAAAILEPGQRLSLMSDD